MRVLDMDGRLLAEGGKPEGTVKIPSHLFNHVDIHETAGTVIETTQGKALIALLPFRLPRPRRSSEAAPERPALGSPPEGRRPPGYVVELAISLKAVSSAFEGLRQNLVVGLIASVILLVSLAIILLRARSYLRGRYLESELQLARRVQRDLQPKPRSVSSHLEFAASAVAADQVGGDFYDIFELESGKIGIVLGDVSGKGVSAALLVSVLQGAIRSALAARHEYACEQINRMLCERTAGERFATLFWGVFDPATGTLRYVNAGHTAPILIRNTQDRIGDAALAPDQAKTQIIRLEEGGPVIGVLPNARYSAGELHVTNFATLVLYSDGINETVNQNEEEFGDHRIARLIPDAADATPDELCDRIMNQLTRFAGPGAPADDRTLLVVRFRTSAAGSRHDGPEIMSVRAVA
jgi:sigma-B regulation protein RsbU (phosphoserine phosphatase)